MDEAATLSTDHLLLFYMYHCLDINPNINGYKASWPEVLFLVRTKLIYETIVRLPMSYLPRKAFVLLMMLSMNHHAHTGSVESYDHYVVNLNLSPRPSMLSGSSCNHVA